MPDQPVPVIFDTDIGTDIDDLYALYFALFNPNIRVLAVTTAYGDTQWKARLVAKALRNAGRTDIPIGAGIGVPPTRVALGELDPASHMGKGYCAYVTPQDPEYSREFPPAMQVIRQALRESDAPASILCIGAASNVAEAVLMPDEALRARIARTALMAGETRRMYREYNVVCDPDACEIVLNCGIPCFLGTFDVTAQLRLSMDDVRREFADLTNPVYETLVSCSELWGPHRGHKQGPVLYDLVPLLWLADPVCIPTCQSTVHVELRGTYTRGMTVRTAETGPVTESTGIDAAPRMADILRVIHHGARSIAQQQNRLKEARMTPELIADYQCACGEGPLWHPGESRVYWVDIPTGRLFRYQPDTGVHEQCYQDVAIGGFTIQADGALLLFMDKGAVKLWREGQVETLIDGLPGEEDSRFNDVIADPAGRVFCGTMPGKDRLGRLYRMDTDGSLVRVLDGIGCSNGLGFTPDRKGLYYTDSPEKTITLFDYDQPTGEISNPRLFTTTQGDGVPDGMTVDAEGYVWSARWDGSCLVRYAPDGSEERRVQFPARKVSSVIFGGADYEDMYVTTAGGLDKASEGVGAGALFRLRAGIRGVPEFSSRVGL